MSLSLSVCFCADPSIRWPLGVFVVFVCFGLCFFVLLGLGFLLGVLCVFAVLCSGDFCLGAFFVVFFFFIFFYL